MENSWHGRFISAHSPADDGDAAPYFRREFSIAGDLFRATLHVSALGIVEAYLNGSAIGDEVIEPGWTSYRHRVGLRSYDVTEHLTPGQNALGAIVSEGWAAGRLGWEGKRHFYTDRPALFLQLELAYPDRTEIIGSDTAFRTSSGAVLAAGIYDGESYDATREPAGWDRPGFDDSTWSRAELFDWPTDVLRQDVAPPVRRTEELTPTSIRQNSSGQYIVDFGQNFTGWVKLSVRGPAGQRITIRHAERLTATGELETATNRTAKATDVYTLRGGELETWEPRFTFHGFQYAEIDGWPGQLTEDAVRGIVVHTEMTRTGWFETSDPLVSRLHENAVWSMRSNFVSIPTDCPQRDERLGWTGDLNAFAPTAALLYDVRGILGSWLKDLAAEQREKGYVPWVVPDVLPNPSAPTAVWSDVAVALPWTLYQEYGDLDILRDSYSSMSEFVRTVEAQLDSAALWSTGFQFGDWLDPDAPYDEPSQGKTDRHLVATAYFSRVTREMAQTAQLLGHADDAAHFDALAKRVRTAFHREYLTPAGRVVNETATAYALALCFDLVDETQRGHAGDRLAEIVAAAGFRISTGFAGTPWVTEALSTTGHLEEAYLLLMQKESPSFLYPVTMGATTTWERWDSVLPDGTLNEGGMTSLNHYALGAITAWLYGTVGGISRTAPGYRTVRIAPRPGGGLTWATTSHDTVHGRISVSWRLDGDSIQMDVEIPEGIEAEVRLPFTGSTPAEKVGAGTHSWAYRSAELSDRPVLTMETPISQLATDRTVWYGVKAVLEKHFPGMPLESTSPAAAQLTLNALLGYIPHVPDGVDDELRSLLSTSA